MTLEIGPNLQNLLVVIACMVTMVLVIQIFNYGG